MSANALQVANARQEIGNAEAVDITDPDLPRQDLVALIVRLGETLRTTARYAEGADTTSESLRSELAELRKANADLQAELARQEVAA